jgi:hypothetical protein
MAVLDRPTESTGGDDFDLAAIASEIEPRYAELRQAAEMYADHQKLRIVTNNRIGSITVNVADYGPHAAALEKLERSLSRQLVKICREAVPVGVVAWQQSEDARGVGEHMLARLLGHLGHPHLAVPKYWARNTTVADDEFGDQDNPKRMLMAGEPYLRSMSQLWQFCGHGAPLRRRAGMTQDEAFALGNPSCKMLTHLLAESVVKGQVRNTDDGKIALGSLGRHYLDTKSRYAERTHSGPCSGGYTNAGGRVVFAKCKVDGHYADAGDPFTPSHLNAIALRHLGKQILMNIFDASREEWCQ